jgi:lincosamide nucleotidyltransferase B/F
MASPEHLLARLDAIARSLEASGHGLALIGLGSVGVERARLDRYSDLDFFAVVEDGAKAAYIDDLSWLTHIAPVAYRFRNTKDGYKLLYEDGIFCEFAVFELPELSTTAYAKGAIIWKRADVPAEIAAPVRPLPAIEEGEEFLLGEALTNLYVGLSRYDRGEKLSASRFIQQYAVDRVLALAHRIEAGRNAERDPFVNDRRFEQRFPELSKQLPSFIQGYERTRESADALLRFITAHFEVNQKMVCAIRKLIDESADQ